MVTSASSNSCVGADNRRWMELHAWMRSCCGSLLTFLYHIDVSVHAYSLGHCLAFLQPGYLVCGQFCHCCSHQTAASRCRTCHCRIKAGPASLLVQSHNAPFAISSRSWEQESLDQWPLPPASLPCFCSLPSLFCAGPFFLPAPSPPTPFRPSQAPARRNHGRNRSHVW